MSHSSLVVVGSGIKFLSHLTTEAKAYIQASQILLYLANEPAMHEWMKKYYPHSKSLDVFYSKHTFRIDAYQAMTNYILDNLYHNKHVCVVVYGHPTVFAKPALDAIILAKQAGYDAKIFPGISAEDCLFADLLINPGSSGCQSYEATDFLLYERKIDPRSHLILWQVGIIGVLSYPTLHDNTSGARLLVSYLSEQYELDHPVVLYEASQYPHIQPRINQLLLNQLPEANFSPLSTLYIPPMKNQSCSKKMLEKLNIPFEK